jgi:colicin import membrane protein
MNELTVSPIEFGIEESKAVIIEQSFLPKIVERDGLISVYENILTKEISKEVCNEASTLRKKLVKVRTGIADIHKVEKAFYLASGRYVDALKNKHTLPIEQMEEKLAEIEKYYENIEKQRIADLQAARELELQPYEVENISALALGVMAESVWVNFLAGTKAAYDNKKEAERLAEEARVEAARLEVERIEAQRIENERLKAEAAEKEKQVAAERSAAAKVLADQKAEAERLLQVERDEAARIAKIEADKVAAERKLAAEALAKEQAAAKKIADELKARKDAEAKAEADRIAAEKKAAKAPVKEKLRLAIHTLSLTLPESDITAELMAKFNGFKEWANKQVEAL